MDQHKANKEDSPSYFARFGTALLDLKKCKFDPEENVDAIITSLQHDSRVEEVFDYVGDHTWSSLHLLHPSTEHYCSECLLTGKDAYEVVNFGHAIVFKLHVPKKNQPVINGIDDTPTEDYWVAWDGISIVVLWSSGGATTIPTSAGHVAFDVIAAAASHAQMEVHEQACSPGCKNKFTHGGISLSSGPPDSSRIEITTRGRVVNYEVPSLKGELDAVQLMEIHLMNTGQLFATFKNEARRILELEQFAQLLVSNLLVEESPRYERGAAKWHWRVLGFLKRIITLSAIRRSFRVRRISSDLWLCMANIDLLMRRIAESQFDLAQSFGNEKSQALFKQDLQRDQDALKRIDLGFARSAVEQSATRRDSRTVAVSTVLGALAGALAGAVGAGVLGP